MANYSEDILEHFSMFMREDFLCDTILMVGDDQLKAHSVILSAASPFFKAIFKEYEKPEMHYIRLPNLEPKIMKVILDYIYSGQLVISSASKEIPEISEPLVEALSLFGIDIEKIIIIEDDAENLKTEKENWIDEEVEDAEVYKDKEADNDDDDVEAPTIYVCSQCQQSFTERDQLNQHFSIHEEQDETIDQCTICQVKTRGKIEMQQHLLYVHNMTRKPLLTEDHLCVQCGKTFAKETSLNAHIARDHESQPIRHYSKNISCSHCAKKFSSISSMRLHTMMVHTHRKPYECAECGRGFIFKSQLIAHARLHTGDRPFPCATCGKTFAALLNLVQHTRIHTGERPYECSECGHRFSQRSHLQTHLRVHTGERPFACDLCTKSYKNRLDLRIHSLRIHQVSIKLRNNNLANNKNK